MFQSHYKCQDIQRKQLTKILPSPFNDCFICVLGVHAHCTKAPVKCVQNCSILSQITYLICTFLAWLSQLTVNLDTINLILANRTC